MSNNRSVKSISIETAMTWDTAPFNLYIQLPDSRFLALFRTGNPIDKQRLQKYAAKGVTTLWSSEQELADAISAELGNVGAGGADPRMEVLTKLSVAVFDQLARLGISEESFNHAKAVGKVVRSVLEKDPKLSDAFLKFQTMQPDQVRHSLMVSALATVLANGMEWIKPSTIENIGLGALLHDIGKLTLPAEILNTDPGLLSQTDRKILEGHCEAGRSILSGLKTIPEEVYMIVAHHHERADGSGYPQGLKDIYIHPLARVVSIANEIVDRYERDQKAGRQTSIKALVEATLAASASRFNRDVVKALQKMVAAEKF
ncbi:MAG: HD domain-containing protein [Bdellovibrionales bacterium]|nr:HD domain-containing protein [Bdellovibrionales bacterium]